MDLENKESKWTTDDGERKNLTIQIIDNINYEIVTITSDLKRHLMKQRREEGQKIARRFRIEMFLWLRYIVCWRWMHAAAIKAV